MRLYVVVLEPLSTISTTWSGIHVHGRPLGRLLSVDILVDIDIFSCGAFREIDLQVTVCFLYSFRERGRARAPMYTYGLDN